MIRWAAQCFWCLLWTSAGGVVLPCQWVWRMVLNHGRACYPVWAFYNFKPSASSEKTREWNFKVLSQLLIQNWGSTYKGEGGKWQPTLSVIRETFVHPKSQVGCSVPKTESNSALSKLGCWSPAELPACFLQASLAALQGHWK